MNNSSRARAVRKVIVAPGILMMGMLLVLQQNVFAGSDAKQKGNAGEGDQKISGDHSRGEELYNASCVVCHGQQAKGGIGPRLAGNPILSNDRVFWKVVTEGRHMMPPLRGVVTDQQMADIRAWLQTLK